MAEISSTIINGVKVTTDEKGNQHFELIDKTSTKPEIDDRSLWQKIKDWFSDTNAKPYVKIRDLSDPYDKRTTNEDPFDDGAGQNNNLEIGVKITF